MKPVRFIALLLLCIILIGCGKPNPLSGTPTLPTAQINITHAPSAETALRTFLDALSQAAPGDEREAQAYATMYALLSRSSQAAITAEDFAKRYTGALNAMSAGVVDYNILAMLIDPQQSQVSFHITYHTSLFGDIGRDFNTSMILEDGFWRLQWDDSLILPELAGGKRLIANVISPARGNIYDRNGKAIATQTDAYALSLVAGDVTRENETAVFNKLAALTGVRTEIISNNYYNYLPGNYVPVGEASASAVRLSGITAFSGVRASPYTSRFYEPNAAPNAVGYTLFISPEEYNAYRRMGYSGGERIGWEGIEKWGEDFLHGRNASTLYIASADGTLETVLAQAEAQPASSITLTIDMGLQQQVQAAMDGLPGAIVVMEVKTGRVLAMVSSPGFDPNWYDLNNINRQFTSEQPTFNRASQGTYPLGSVFKIVSMAAALESGSFTPNTTYQCGYTFTDIPGHTLFDWTWERCNTEKQTRTDNTCPSWPPSGNLTLIQGLMRSCDPWFYHIGLTLWNENKGNQISDMARTFGLGSATGIAQVAESKGNIPDPADGLQATSIAIGQSDVQVTPLQVAAFIAAIGNGGTLFRPQLVEKVQPVTGEALNVFKPQANGTLPVSADHLKNIQDAMISVVKDSKGTAYSVFVGFPFTLAAKTGTAESGALDPHAWFAGYSLAERPDKPDIAVAVLVNYQGEGSIWAAPIFRRVMEIYFNGRPQNVYKWETTFGVINPNYGLPVPTPAPTPAQ